MVQRAFFMALLFLVFNVSKPLRAADEISIETSKPTVYIIPIREDIMPPLTYLVRRGVKEAMTAKAQCLVLDMQTNGGRVDITEEIIQIISRFQGRKITFINAKAFSAGAFISVATEEIYMSPVSVIGAAAPIMMSPGGGASEMPNTMEVKMTSGISALIRATAEQNGHDPAVVEAMIDKSKELIKDGKVLSEKGQILTLTNTEAEAMFGDPPVPLLSLGTVASMEALLEKIGYADAKQVRIVPTGAEDLGTWINKLSPLLLILGIIGIYLEFKTPGFGIPGILGIVSFAIYFMGGYIAGLSGLEWAVFFALGVCLLIVELFFLPGTIVIGLAGIVLMAWSILMGLVDLDPTLPVWQMPPAHLFMHSLSVFSQALVGSILCILALSVLLPKTNFYHQLVSATSSGEQSVQHRAENEQSILGSEGIAMSALRPGGKARFGKRTLDVITNGPMLPLGTKIRIINFSTHAAVVEEMKS
ncbi:MAG: hypothetical protein P8L18_03455 [Verrucomicrobiota bacterium]|nr:hypothetical protein [Verrucomicrobiota bacterium]